MIESSLAKSGYENSIQSTGNDRGVEYQIFARITRELASSDKSASNFAAKLTEALYNNLRLWTKLAVDVANENNQLPAELRSKIFYLAEFTRHHTAKIYAGDADPKALIDVNTSVMRGLRASTGPAEEAS